MMRVPMTSSPRPATPAGVRAQIAAQLLIGAPIVVLALSMPLHGQDPDTPSLQMLDLKVIALTQELAILKEKVAALQQQGSKVKAPFEVTDTAGKTLVKIESVSSGQAAVTVGSGAGGVSIGVGASGAGALIVRRADGKVGAEISQQGGRPMGLLVYGDTADPVAQLRPDSKGKGMLDVGDPGAGGVTMGTGGTSGAGAVLVRGSNGKVAVELSQQTGRFAVTVSGSSGSPLASFGEAKVGGGVFAAYNTAGTIGAILSGTGQVHVADGKGQSLATMVSENGQGAFSVRNASGTTIARLSEGNSGGVLQLANSGGNAMVDAGVLPSGVGAVRTYPLGIPPGAALGMPGTFIMGFAGKK
jgi:hypothetical protein